MQSLFEISESQIRETIRVKLQIESKIYGKQDEEIQVRQKKKINIGITPIPEEEASELNERATSREKKLNQLILSPVKISTTNRKIGIQEPEEERNLTPKMKFREI